MRLSEWRAGAPHKDAMTATLLAVVEPVLAALGAPADPPCWVAWGDDPTNRYTLFAPTAAGLVTCHVRVNIPGEGPRASAKLVRWARAQLGELAIETQEGHRIVSFQVEGQVLRGVDRSADEVAAFALDLFDAVDGRPVREGSAAPRPRSTAAAGGPKRKAAAGTSPGGGTSNGAAARR